MSKERVFKIFLVAIFILCTITLSSAAEEKVLDLNNSDAIPFWEVEPNNTLEYADLVDGAVTGYEKYAVFGAISYRSYDIDYYRFNVVSDVEMEVFGFWMDDLHHGRSEEHLLIGLADYRGETINVTSLSGYFGSYSKNMKTTLSPGTYYLIVLQKQEYQYLFVDEIYGISVEFTSLAPAEVGVTDVSLNKHSITLTEGESETLRATVSPSNAANQNVTWSSSNESVATVNSNGRVLAAGEGETTITVRTVDGGRIATATVTVEKEVAAPKPVPETANINRLSGLNRYSTAGDIANEYFKDGVDTVILARGDHQNDNPQITSALVSASLTGVLDIPILLTIQDRVPNATLDALDELNPRNILIIGNENEVSAAVEKDLAMEYNITRISGRNLSETAKEIALYTGQSREAAYIVQTDALPDALAIGSVASATGNPILLTNKDSIPSATLEAINTLGIRDVYIIGGTAVISDSVEQQLNNAIDGTVKRVAGLNRFETSVEIGKAFWNTADKVTIANGVSMVDAVASSILQRPLMLVRHNRIVGSAQEEIKGYGEYTIIGGETVVEKGLIENAIK